MWEGKAGRRQENRAGIVIIPSPPHILTFGVECLITGDTILPGKMDLSFLFRLGPNSHFAALFDLNMDDVRSAADRTIFDVLLAFTSR